MKPIITMSIVDNPTTTVKFIKTKNEVLLAIEELTGIAFRCWQDNDGYFQIEAYVGKTQVFFIEEGCMRFDHISGNDLETIERDMANSIARGVVATKSWLDDPDTWNIPPFSNIDELRMKASLIGGEIPFKNA